jgi:hypothetical protein
MKEFPLFNIEFLSAKPSYPQVVYGEQEFIQKGIALNELSRIPQYGVLYSHGKIFPHILKDLSSIKAHLIYSDHMQKNLYEGFVKSKEANFQIYLEQKLTLFSCNHHKDIYYFPEIRSLAEELFLSYEEKDIAHQIQSYLNNGNMYAIRSLEDVQKKYNT